MNWHWVRNAPTTAWNGNGSAMTAVTSSPASSPASPAPELRQQFLAGMSNAAATVNVVTTDGPAGRFGVTVSAMASVSADTPKPTLLVCVHNKSSAAAAILANGVFCVNVLRDDQSYISDTFAGRIKTADGDKFSCAHWVNDITGSPRVIDPLVGFGCRVTHSELIGTHHVVFGAVEEIFTAGSGSPLIYANRAYGTPARMDVRVIDGIGEAKPLRLGVFHSFGPYVVPKVLEKLATEGAAIDLKLLEGDQRKILEGLKTGEIDLALAYDFDLGADIGIERLTALEPYVLLPEHHPLAARAALKLAELVDEPMILLDSPPSSNYFLSLFSEKQLTPKVRLRTASFEMVRGLVGAGFGYSLLATKPASPVSYDGRALTTRPIRDKSTPAYLALITRKGEKLTGAAAAFAIACRGLFAKP